MADKNRDHRQESYSVLKRKELNRLYAFAYAHGHHDSVEGVYTDVHMSDVDEYHSEQVQDFIDDLIDFNRGDCDGNDLQVYSDIMGTD